MTHQGFTLVEVLVSLAIIVSSALGMLFQQDQFFQLFQHTLHDCQQLFMSTNVFERGFHLG